MREVGNVDPATEITFQFGANEQDADGEKTTLSHLELAFVSKIQYDNLS